MFIPKQGVNCSYLFSFRVLGGTSGLNKSNGSAFFYLSWCILVKSSKQNFIAKNVPLLGSQKNSIANAPMYTLFSNDKALTQNFYSVSAKY